MSVVSFPERGDSRPLTERVAEEVRALMARRGVTQMQLTRVLALSQTGVSKRLRGITPFDANEMGVLADYFGVSPAELLGVRGPRPGPDGGGGVEPGAQVTSPYTRPLSLVRAHHLRCVA